MEWLESRVVGTCGVGSRHNEEARDRRVTLAGGHEERRTPPLIAAVVNGGLAVDIRTRREESLCDTGGSVHRRHRQ